MLKLDYENKVATLSSYDLKNNDKSEADNLSDVVAAYNLLAGLYNTLARAVNARQS